MSRGPVSWIGLGLVAVAAASSVGYYQIERERRLENAMGKIVSKGFCDLESFSFHIYIESNGIWFWIVLGWYRYPVSRDGHPIQNFLPNDNLKKRNLVGFQWKMLLGEVRRFLFDI